MKFLFYNFLLSQLFLYISTFDKEWNFKNASFNLLNESNNFRFKYVIYNKTISNYEVILSKTIYKNENLIKDENIIEITNTNNKQNFSVMLIGKILIISLIIIIFYIYAQMVIFIHIIIITIN